MTQDVREVKAMFLGSKDLMEEWRTALDPTSQEPQTGNGATTQTQFRTLVRNVLAIGAGLSQTRELRGIFVDIIEKVVEPCAGLGWGLPELQSFFDTLEKQFAAIPSLNSSDKRRYHPSFGRLISGVKLASVRLYKRMYDSSHSAHSIFSA
jgi:hypothetical protein